MVPSREIFGNIMYGEVLYIIGTIVVGIFLYAFYRRTKLWRLGKPDNRFSDIKKRIRAFINIGIVEGLFHMKILGMTPRKPSLSEMNPQEMAPKEAQPGIAHFLIFGGCTVLILGAFVDFISHYFFHFMEGRVYLGYSVVVDAFGVLVLVGAVIFLVRRYGQRPERLDNKPEDLVAILLIVFVVIGGFVVEGFRIAATELPTTPDWALWSPGGYLLARAFSGLNESTLLTWHRITWWIHMVMAFGAIAYVSLFWNRLWHIIVSPLNVFFRSLGPKGVIAPIDLEKAETFGTSKVQDFTWKQLLDVDACVRCGRCQDLCPAYASGKPLNPKKVVQDIKTQLLEEAPYLMKGAAPEKGKDLITERVGVDEIWNCTTCRACDEACPIYVDHIDKIIDMRRSLVLDRATIPETAEGALRSIEARGHPWRGTTATRTGWAEGLDIKALSDSSDVDILYWVGCTSALEDRSIKVAQAIARVLKLSGVNFGILGTEETCCGDPARRLGNEYLFQTLAQANIELLKNYKVKKIVTGCPHCYHMLKNEYPQFGGEFEVTHHTELIAGLLQQEKLKVIKSIGGRVTYHDACYLGRYNDIFDYPRQILSDLPDITLVEMNRNKDRSFCCGAGGGHLWLEEQKKGERINVMRTEQAMETRAKIIATACPYCLQMFEDGIKAKAAEETLKTRDIAELVAEAAVYAPPKK